MKKGRPKEMDIKNIILILTENGYNLSQIAEILNMSRQLISYHLNSYPHDKLQRKSKEI